MAGVAAHYKVNVDLTAPEAPPLVLSLTHPAGVGVSNRFATATWTPGSDATSGVAGYSLTFNQDQALEDKGTKEFATATSRCVGRWPIPWPGGPLGR